MGLFSVLLEEAVVVPLLFFWAEEAVVVSFAVLLHGGGCRHGLVFCFTRGGCRGIFCCFAVWGLSWWFDLPFCCLEEAVGALLSVFCFAARRLSFSHCLICCMWGCRGTF